MNILDEFFIKRTPQDILQERELKGKADKLKKHKATCEKNRIKRKRKNKKNK